MQRIENLNKWMKGKCVQSVNEKACNCTFIVFTDGSILCLEVEAVDHGFYGVVPYEMTQEAYKQSQRVVVTNN